MATSGSKSITVTNYDTLKFSWSEKTKDITNNKTTISWKLELISTTYGKIISSVLKDWSVTVNGEKYSGTNYVSIENNATKTLASGTTTIEHNSDGTKTFSYSFSQEFAINFNSEYIGTKSGSGTGTLDTIPRKSTLSVSNGTLGTEQTLTVARHSDEFTHTIVATCGDQTKTICTKSKTESIKFTPPLEWASENTSGTSLSVNYTITTYNGSSSLGSNSYTKTCSIPSSVAPSCSVSVTDPEGYLSIYGGYIKGLSKFKVVVTPTLAHDSPIASYSVKANGSTYTEASFTTDVLKSSGSLQVEATVKDKRGRSGSKTVNATVLDYSPPVISKLTVGRCNANGTANDKGEYVKVTYSGNVTSLNNKNTAKWVLQYKKSSAANYTSVELHSGAIYSIADGTYIFAADSGSSYDVRLEVTDNFGTTPKTTSASTGFTIMHYLANGLGIAFGKIAEISGVLDIGFKTRFMGGILQPILADGVDFNTIMTPNTYSGKNASTSGYANCPISSEYSFSLEVIAASENSQLIQRLTTFNKSLPVVYERVYSGGSWGAWTDNNPYPVGSIYMSVNNKNPSKLFGGTWEQIKDVFLLAAGNTYAAGSTGGEATHTLTVEEIPEHQHALHYRSIYSGDGSTSAITSKSYSTGNTSKENGALATGDGKAHNNMPPYLAVYVWKRTA